MWKPLTAGSLEKIELKTAAPEDLKDIKILLSYYFIDTENINYKDFIIATSRKKVKKVIGCASMIGNELRLIAVHPSYRGRGIGTKLVEYLASNVREIYLRTTAPQFFEKLGFVALEDNEKKYLWEDCAVCDMFDVCAQTAMRRKII